MPNLSNENVEVDGKLDCMWLSPNQKKKKVYGFCSYNQRIRVGLNVIANYEKIAI